MTSAPVRVFTFTPERGDRGPVVGVNHCSGKRGGRKDEDRVVSGPTGGRFCMFGQGRGEDAEVLSKQVSVVSFRRRVSSSMGFFHRFKRYTSPLCPSASSHVHHPVSQNLTVTAMIIPLDRSYSHTPRAPTFL